MACLAFHDSLAPFTTKARMVVYIFPLKKQKTSLKLNMQKHFKTGKLTTQHKRKTKGSLASLKPFSFVHAADLHLGYSQYGLEARRQDFDDAFKELVDKTIELKPDFMIIAGDLFHQARPSNHTLENTIRSFKRLKDCRHPSLNC